MNFKGHKYVYISAEIDLTDKDHWDLIKSKLKAQMEQWGFTDVDILIEDHYTLKERGY